MTSSHSFEHTMASNTCRYWSLPAGTLDLPAYRGTGVEVKRDLAEVCAGAVGRPALQYRDSARTASKSFCNCSTAFSSLIIGEFAWYSSSGGHPDLSSGTSLPEETVWAEEDALMRGALLGPLPTSRHSDARTRHQLITSPAFR